MNSWDYEQCEEFYYDDVDLSALYEEMAKEEK